MCFGYTYDQRFEQISYSSGATVMNMGADVMFCSNTGGGDYQFAFDTADDAKLFETSLVKIISESHDIAQHRDFVSYAPTASASSVSAVVIVDKGQLAVVDLNTDSIIVPMGKHTVSDRGIGELAIGDGIMRCTSANHAKQILDAL